MKAIYFACGLLMAAGAQAATISGTINVRLTITNQCQINGQAITPQGQPSVNCVPQPSAQPKVTLSTLEQEANIKQETRLITVEW
ncbi:hypothetical protein ACFSFZ_17885 [Mixta tenebrionis]|uniref:DUF2574 family protein n=1 Tax=Mixta tenebrionis TaxID=2562439 RepID=A0A506VEJ4_9GAMM|nr:MULTISPECIES: hypothetical protein [Mixta]QHM76616.1 hypothetical protein C7M52_02599 [Mixta theicola]TPW43962.1 hypothetical protein FKM52_05340 [Mixta tenebrionis]